ncbi:MAG: Uma2 family endonuclease [Hyphomonadaceae bacterium]|nr:Uma2 family endonuclease [Hyphomonadaceae bacterium]
MADGARPLSLPLHMMDAGPRERLLTVAEFDRMGEAGFFAEEGRHELWDGRVMMAPSPGTPHIDNASRLNEALILAMHAAGLLGRFRVAADGGLQIGDGTLLGPDLMVVKLPIDRSRRLTGADVALVVEIAHTTLKTDLVAKREKYAAADVPEYWVLDVEGAALHVFRTPRGVEYVEHQAFESGAQVSPLFAPNMILNVADFV